MQQQSIVQILIHNGNVRVIAIQCDHVCLSDCPSGAIDGGEEKGDVKWKVDFGFVT